MKPESISLFDKKLEWINLLLPVGFILLMIFEYLQGWNISRDSFWSKVLTDIIFLNITHNIFTFVLIFWAPELSDWAKFQGGRKLFWFNSIGITLFIMGFFFAVFKGMGSYWVKTFYLFTIFFFPIHHALSQSFGLSYLYNSQEKSLEVKAVEVWERRFSFLFLGSMMAITFLIVFQYRKVVNLSPGTYSFLKNVLSFLMVTMFLFMMGNSLRYPGLLRFKKIFYGLRYIVWMATIFSPVAVIGTRTIHGIEYGLVTHKMVKNSRGKLILPMIFGTVLIIYFCYIRLVVFETFRSDAPLPTWMLLIAAFSVALSYLHYYMDRSLFRMRHPINRKTVASLLKS